MTPSNTLSTEPRPATPSNLTIGWFARRSAMWLATIAAGVSAACMIYAFAEENTPTATTAAPAAIETGATR